MIRKVVEVYSSLKAMVFTQDQFGIIEGIRWQRSITTQCMQCDLLDRVKSAEYGHGVKSSNLRYICWAACTLIEGPSGSEASAAFYLGCIVPVIGEKESTVGS